MKKIHLSQGDIRKYIYMRRLKQGASVLGLILGLGVLGYSLISSVQSPSAQVGAAVMLFSDGFEANNFKMWDAQTNGWTISDSGHQGSNSARIVGKATNAVIEKDLPVFYKSNYNLSYWFKTSYGWNTDDIVNVEYYDGANWRTLYTHSIENGSWTNNAIDLPQNALNNSDLKIRFRGTVGSNASFYLDDVEIKHLGE